MKLIRVLLLILVWQPSDAQTYFAYQGDSPNKNLMRITLDCHCVGCCNIVEIGNTQNWGDALTMSPEGRLYGIDNVTNDLFLIDTLTGASSLYFDLPNDLTSAQGLVTLGGGIFYSFIEQDYNEADTIIEINVPAGTVTKLGRLNYRAFGDLAVLDGEIYYLSNLDTWNTNIKLVKLNLEHPDQSTLILSMYPQFGGWGLSATKFCNTFIYTDLFVDDELVLVNSADGTMYSFCTEESIFSLTSMQEFIPTTICNEVDLDCDDSSLALIYDYNSREVNCLNHQAPISDKDPTLFYDTVIAEMTVTISGSVPDGDNESLELIGGYSVGVDVSGSGTHVITMINNGLGSADDYKFLLKHIFYQNVSDYPTGGVRAIEVRFTTASGTVSEMAIGFVPVVELPYHTVDLGPDFNLCEGEIATLDAGSPGPHYEWSTGENSQTIHVDQFGIYSVSVSGGQLCPNQDTIQVDFNTIVTVDLSGDNIICGAEEVFLDIEVGAGLPLEIILTAYPGGPIFFEEVTGSYSLSVMPDTTTTYVLSVVPSDLMTCIQLQDSVQTIEVFQDYEFVILDTICDGDSVLVGYEYIKDPGVFDNQYTALGGCDSLVTTTVTVLPVIGISKVAFTCDTTQSGTFISYLNNPNGCDTVVTKTVAYVPTDTTNIQLLSCRQSNVGVQSIILQNQAGCDSVVITTTSYLPPSDTTAVFQTTCDATALGVVQQIMSDANGCDSLVITTTTLAQTDTIFLSAVSCDPLMIGIHEQLLQGFDGCDSLVITNTIAGIPDTTFVYGTSCDPASLGVFVTHFVNIDLCDSVEIRTITFSAQDSTFIQSSTCDANSAGVFETQFTNQFGCDSIITETISLLTSNEIFISSATCDPNAAGNFDHHYFNQFGCDSLVHENVALIPSTETHLTSTTCRSSDAGVFETTFQNQYGCDSIVTLTVSLVPGDTTQFFLKTCNPDEVGSMETIFSNQDGCDSLVIESTDLYLLPQVHAEALSDYHGYNVSCFGTSDGNAAAIVAGTSSWNTLWSDGQSIDTLSGLAAGDYILTVTDENGCETTASITLTQPDTLSIALSVSQPECFNHHFGTITIQSQGGVGPITFSIDGTNFQSSPVFTNLSNGAFHITALDANDCEAKEIILINVPVSVSIDLGSDLISFPGDTSIIHALVNVPYDSLASIVWTGLNNPLCPTCLMQLVAPIITTTYSITVNSVDGCSDVDSLTLYIHDDEAIYIPNVFSPNGDGINDLFLISAGPAVDEIDLLQIFDRWGNLIFEARHFPPNDPVFAWDGSFNGKPLDPGVFVNRILVKSSGDRVEVRNGEVTIVK